MQDKQSEFYANKFIRQFKRARENLFKWSNLSAEFRPEIVGEETHTQANGDRFLKRQFSQALGRQI